MVGCPFFRHYLLVGYCLGESGSVDKGILGAVSLCNNCDDSKDITVSMYVCSLLWL